MGTAQAARGRLLRLLVHPVFFSCFKIFLFLEQNCTASLRGHQESGPWPRRSGKLVCVKAAELRSL